MARKPNIFGSVMSDIEREQAEEGMTRPAPAVTPPAPLAAEPPVPGAFRRGPVAALHNDLRQSMGQTLRDIDPALIDASPYADRLEIRDEDVRDLADSIRKHGLRVPILLRPSPEHPGRFIIVYGRRRLAALRLIGQSARALVREMTDQDSLLAQGQENNARVDPSFIEKALFLQSLEQAGYPPEVVLDALCVSKAYLSHMRRVVSNVPESTIRAIGPAHGVGWKRWHEAVDLILGEKLDPSVPQGLLDAAEPGTDLFGIWHQHLRKVALQGRHAASQAIVNKGIRRRSTVFVPDTGKRIGEVRRTASGVVQLMSDPAQEEFSRWLDANGEEQLTRLYAEWAKANGG